MNTKSTIRTSLLVSSAMTALVFSPAQANAAADETTGVKDIVVTAQKREQSIQDVPVAITAFTGDALEANRISTVNDLSGLAPGLTVRPSAGGIATPAFTMRGQVSFGVVAGSDKQISIYLDGVYISSPRGSIFDLPDVQRIEVLRGPQGTLFGRNATGGAISITTRDPTGDAHVKVKGTVSNYSGYRYQVTAEPPKVGPLSAYVTFVRNYRHGDIRQGAPTLLWDRTAAGPRFSEPAATSKYLGTVDSDSYFAAVKFEPHPDFKIVYKYDRNRDTGSGDGTAFVGYDPLAPLTGDLVTALITSQPYPVYQTPDARRPKVVSNNWVVPRDMLVQGHSATATWNATDNLTIKNVFAYRKVYVHATSSIDGLSSMVFTPQALGPLATLYGISSLARQGVNVADPANAAQVAATIQYIAGLYAPLAGLTGLPPSQFMLVSTQATSGSEQYSDELQFNWQSGPLNVTAGAMWFHGKDNAGGPGFISKNSLSLTIYSPKNFVAGAPIVVPTAPTGSYFDKSTSLAAYLQLEYKVTPTVTLVAGGRITRDKKDEIFTFGPNPASTQAISPPTYKKTKPNYALGVNWQPNRDILVYAKYATSFVSGGTSVGVVYKPETVRSIEGGVKADLLDRRLRVNLAVFDAKYNHFQAPQGTSQEQSAALIILLTTPLYGAAIAQQLPGTVGTFVFDQGKLHAYGAELEVTAAPADGVGLGGSLGYTHTSYPYIDPLGIQVNGGQPIAPINRPKLTSTVWASYETPPLWDEATMTFRIDGNFRSRSLLDQNQARNIPELEVLKATPAYWVWNARVALSHVNLGGGTFELAAWAKNFTNQKKTNFALIQPLVGAANFITARTYGLDLTAEF